MPFDSVMKFDFRFLDKNWGRRRPRLRIGICTFSPAKKRSRASVFFLQVFRERGFTGTAATAGAGNFRIADFVNFFSHPKSKVEQCAEHEYGGKNNVEHGEKGDG